MSKGSPRDQVKAACRGYQMVVRPAEQHEADFLAGLLGGIELVRNLGYNPNLSAYDLVSWYAEVVDEFPITRRTGTTRPPDSQGGNDNAL